MWQQKAPQLLNTWLTRDYYGDHYTECHLILSAWNHVRYLFFARHFVNMELNSALHIEWIKWPQTVNVVSSSLIFFFTCRKRILFLILSWSIPHSDQNFQSLCRSANLPSTQQSAWSTFFSVILANFRAFWEEILGRTLLLTTFFGVEIR